MSSGPQVPMAKLRDEAVQALLQLAVDSFGARNIIVNCHGVQKHLIKISEQVQEHRMRSDQHLPPAGSAAAPMGSWPHDLRVALISEGHVQGHQRSVASSATNAEARDQLDTQESTLDDYAKKELAYTHEGETKDRDNAQPGEKPRSRKAKAKCNKGKDEAEEPPGAGDTALIVKGIHAKCGRDDVHAMLEGSGFTKAFDLLYVPKDFVNRQNRGYFHVNFREAADAEKFSRMLQSRPSDLAVNWAIANPNSRLVAHRARHQGLYNFVMDLMSGRKFRAENKEYLPWVYLPGSSQNGCPLTKQMAEQLLSSEFHGSDGSPSSSGNEVTM
ncbi:unnamed protein product [Prorocentrum cordatum]|uniref:RRM domain-containing protein n=1 Tax=Prorocentrum cordatum TaxID=2364126 RepID=A0ABN9VM27_9DINO|nr:unnamed protein product [Polarella glacialis]